MSLVRWQPMRELDLLRREMDQLFEGLTDWNIPSLSMNGETTWMPEIELKETDNDVILKAQIPGMDPKDLDVQVSPEAVMIAGERRQETKTEEKGFFRSEFRYGRFSRTIPLPTEVRHDQVTSTFKDGLLTLTLPKTEGKQRKVVKVEVKPQ
jgi:HSP20 family protein